MILFPFWRWDSNIPEVERQKARKQVRKNDYIDWIDWSLPLPWLSCKHYQVFVGFCLLSPANLWANKSNSIWHPFQALPNIQCEPRFATGVYTLFWMLTNVTCSPSSKAHGWPSSKIVLCFSHAWDFGWHVTLESNIPNISSGVKIFCISSSVLWYYTSESLSTIPDLSKACFRTQVIKLYNIQTYYSLGHKVSLGTVSEFCSSPSSPSTSLRHDAWKGLRNHEGMENGKGWEGSMNE